MHLLTHAILERATTFGHTLNTVHRAKRSGSIGYVVNQNRHSNSCYFSIRQYITVSVRSSTGNQAHVLCAVMLALLVDITVRLSLSLVVSSTELIARPTRIDNIARLCDDSYPAFDTSMKTIRTLAAGGWWRCIVYCRLLLFSCRGVASSDQQLNRPKTF